MAGGYLFVPDLSPLTLLWARCVASLAGREIIYLRLAATLQTDAGMARLQRAGARAFSFEDCQSPDNGYYYGDKPGIAGAVADQLAETACYSRCLSLYDGIADHDTKLRIVLRSYVDQDCFDLTHVLAWLTGQENPGASWVLAPMGFIRRRYLKLSGLAIRPCPGSVMLGLFDGLGRFWDPLKRLTRKLARRDGSKPTPGAVSFLPPGFLGNPSTFPASVLYFPHQTVSYGGLFFKDQFYSKDPASPFHASRILHLELTPPRLRKRDPALEAFHSEHDIHWGILSLPGGIGRFRHALESFAEVLGRAGPSVLAGRAGITSLSIQVRARWQYKRYRKGLSAFPNARIALIGYEILTPKLLCLALDSLGIQTVASQERFHAPIFYNNWNFILHTYFTGSPSISGFIKQSRFKYAAKPIAVGQVRTDLLTHCRARYSRQETLPESAGYDGVVVVYDAPGFTDPHVARMMYVANRKSNKAFFKDIIRLAQHFTETLFVIRSKDTAWTHIADYAETVEAIEAQPNLLISRHDSAPAFQYRLAAIADLVIAKYSSIGDECLGLGIPMIFHDYTPVLPASAHRTYDYGGLPVFVHDYDVLLARTGRSLAEGHYLSAEEVENLAVLVNGRLADGRVRERIGEHLDRLLPPEKQGATS